MINSFWNDGTNNLYNGVTIGLPKQVVRKAIKILTALDATDNLLALRTLGIRAEKKEGKVKGARRYPNKWHCIDVDKQYRIIFTWRDGKANNVLFIDYH